MSGGHYDYTYHRINSLVDDIELDFYGETEESESCAMRLEGATEEQRVIILSEVDKLIRDLKDVSRRARNLDLYMSGDYGHDSYIGELGVDDLQSSQVKEFAEDLSKFFKEELKSSDEFCRRLDECDSFNEIKLTIKDSRPLKRLLGINELEDKVEELEDEVEELKGDSSRLMRENDEMRDIVFTHSTYWERQKFELFIKNQEKFTLFEFEDIMTKK